VLGLVVILYAGRAAYRWLYFRNVSWFWDSLSIGHVDALGKRRTCQRHHLAHVEVTSGARPSFTSPSIAPKLTMWSASGDRMLVASIKYFSMEDIRQLAAALNVPTDGPDGVWIK
jgi:hypothetical protein